MPAYCFTCDHCGRTHEVNQSIHAKTKKKSKCECGQMADRDLQAEQCGFHRMAMACVDHGSEALAVDPGDIKKEWNEDRKINKFSAPDYYDKIGCPHWTGNLQDVMQRKNKYMRERGYHHNNSYC